MACRPGPSASADDSRTGEAHPARRLLTSVPACKDAGRSRTCRRRTTRPPGQARPPATCLPKYLSSTAPSDPDERRPAGGRRASRDRDSGVHVRSVEHPSSHPTLGNALPRPSSSTRTAGSAWRDRLDGRRLLAAAPVGARAAAPSACAGGGSGEVTGARSGPERPPVGQPCAGARVSRDHGPAPDLLRHADYW